MKIDIAMEDLPRLLSAVLLPHEMEEALDLIQQIRHLKKQRNALVLGHNYMSPEVYWGTSDYVGDSLGLSRLAAECDSPVILFNGVHFMAETAKVLNPEKTVLIADPHAGCSLAESINSSDIRALKAKYPGAPVVTYVNCTADAKSETDICCTSANAVKVVNSLDSDTVIFLPDAYLAKNVAKESSKRIISWDKGACMVHELYRPEDIHAARRQFPDLMVITHPECDTSVTELADFSGSTSQMEQAIRTSPHKNILLITECGMADNLRGEFPKHNFISTCHTCPHMKKITLEKILYSLQTMTEEVVVPKEIADKARLAVQRMIAIG